MKIINKDCLFKSLKVGDTFYSGNTLYVKIDERTFRIIDSIGKYTVKYNCFNLHSNQLSTMQDSNMVTKVNIEIRVV